MSTPSASERNAGVPAWLREAAPQMRLRGNASLLAERPVVVLASRQCPGAVLLKAAQWAEAWAQALPPERSTLAGGFQTPAEKEVLHRLLRSEAAPVAHFPARALPKRLPEAEREALDAGRLVLVSAFPASQRRPSARLAARRNALLSQLAKAALVLHAAPGSRTLAWTKQAVSSGLSLFTLDHEVNESLFALGATPAREMIDA